MNLVQVANIRSLVHRRNQNLVVVDLDEGYWDLDVYADLDKAKGDVPGYVKMIIAQHIKLCSDKTGIPMGEDHWVIQYSPWTIEELNIDHKGFTV